MSGLSNFVNGGAPVDATWFNGVDAATINSPVNVTAKGALGNGIADETTALQNAINAAATSSCRKVFIPWGVSGNYLVSRQLTISADITIEWENSSTTLTKIFNGDLFLITSFLVKLVNPGINGNGSAGYTGGAIRYYGVSYGCVIENPQIVNTYDSCVIIDNTPGSAANDLVIWGGTLTPYNPSGMTSAGPAAIRAHGPTDSSPANRKVFGTTASTQPLIDITGMWQTSLINCFTGTVIYSGNPNVTGITNPPCSELTLLGTYVRDGMSITGWDHVIDGCIDHGYFPIYSSYGVVSGYSSSWGWQLLAGAQNVSIGQSNEISNFIQDLSPNGLGDICCKYFQRYLAFDFAWTGASANPAIGNGTFLNQTYSVDGGNITINYAIQFGSTTTLGTGQWYFSLPFWSGATATAQPLGNWWMYIPTVSGTSATSCTVLGTTMTLGGTIAGDFAVGTGVSGTNITPGSYVVALGTSNGTNAGTIYLNVASYVASGESVIGGGNRIITGTVWVSGTGNPQSISLVDSNGVIVGSTYLATIPSGAELFINMTYARY